MTRKFILRTAIYMAACGVVSIRAAAQELPPIPSNLLNTSSVACIKVSQSGLVEGAFILASTGDRARDATVLEWVRELHWAQAKPDEKLRGQWFPMPVAFGEAKPLPMPPGCSPLLRGVTR